MRITGRQLRQLVNEEIERTISESGDELSEKKVVQAQIKMPTAKPQLSSPAPFTDLLQNGTPVITADMSENWTFKFEEGPEGDISYSALFSDGVYNLLTAFINRGGGVFVKGKGAPGFPFRIYETEALKKFLGRP